MVSVISSSPDVVKARTEQTEFSPIELWGAVMLHESRREQQRQRMVEWRQRKKVKVAGMIQERLRLEKQLKLQVNEARVASDGTKPSSTRDAYLQATIQTAALARENVALREALDQQTTFKTILQRDTQEFLNQIRPDDSLPPRTVKLMAADDDGGWCVQFSNAAPFYFSPFTRDEYDQFLSLNEASFAERHPCTATVGTMFGWKVDYAPLARNADGSSFVAHARFSRRIRCSLDDSDRILPQIDKGLWPVLVAARSWGRVQSGGSCYQTLQNFEENCHVLACNIPGDVSLRYIALAQHSRGKSADGKRQDKYILTITDSEANARNRAAEGAMENVQWVLEGGIHMTITEIDEATIDVVFDHWAGCLSESHGRELYIDWIQFPVRLEQCVSPARLLCF